MITIIWTISVLIALFVGYRIGKLLTRMGLEYQVRCAECRRILYKSECKDLGHERLVCPVCQRDIYLQGR